MALHLDPYFSYIFVLILNYTMLSVSYVSCFCHVKSIGGYTKYHYPSVLTREIAYSIEKCWHAVMDNNAKHLTAKGPKWKL